MGSRRACPSGPRACRCCWTGREFKFLNYKYDSYYDSGSLNTSGGLHAILAFKLKRATKKKSEVVASSAERSEGYPPLAVHNFLKSGRRRPFRTPGREGGVQRSFVSVDGEFQGPLWRSALVCSEGEIVHALRTFPGTLEDEEGLHEFHGPPFSVGWYEDLLAEGERTGRVPLARRKDDGECLSDLFL